MMRARLPRPRACHDANTRQHVRWQRMRTCKRIRRTPGATENGKAGKPQMTSKSLDIGQPEARTIGSNNPDAKLVRDLVDSLAFQA